MKYQAVEVGVSPKSGLKVFRYFLNMSTFTSQEYIRIEYVQYHLGLDGSELMESTNPYMVENKPAEYDAEGNMVKPASNKFDEWRGLIVTDYPAGTTLEQIIVGAVNQTLLQIPIE